ncbi:MAG: Gfo/Idh/MocA family oxidoreductase [Acidimicrobiia bacterium]
MARPGAVVVGTGFGCRVHVPALRAAGFDVVALVGADPERTERRAERSGVPNACTDLDTALALDGVVAVTVATPPHTHAAVAIAAANAGKHVICEKPFALDAVEARAMLAAAEAAGITHLVGHEFRWAPERSVAARALAAGAIGEPRFASFVSYVPLVADPEAKVPRWWFDEESGGGWLGASGSHVVDQIRTWLGEFASVSATLSVVSARQGVAEDSFTVRFRTRSGVDGVLQQTAAAWGPYGGMTKVAGTDGSLWSEGDAVWLADRDGTRVLPVPEDLVPPPAPDESDDPRHKFTHLEVGPYTRLCEVLLAGVEGREHRAPVPVPTFADGVACMEVLDAIRASAAADGAVVSVG